MSSAMLRKLMYALLVVGLSMAIAGVGLVMFTDLETSGGMRGLMIIIALTAGGLLISVPAKLFLTYQLMRHNDEKQAAKRRTT